MGDRGGGGVDDGSRGSNGRDHIRCRNMKIEETERGGEYHDDGSYVNEGGDGGCLNARGMA